MFDDSVFTFFRPDLHIGGFGNPDGEFARVFRFRCFFVLDEDRLDLPGFVERLDDEIIILDAGILLRDPIDTGGLARCRHDLQRQIV